jgi:lipopolysaccharide/colanic/teichoic acid biosynthesis glycosyltransferase
MELFSKLVGVISLVILTPLFIILIFLSFIFQGLPIFFHHDRIGYKYEKFRLIKFRSMDNSNNDNPITDKQDIRITKWGKIIRFLKLDELPQLINIIKGDMRFVGPRPEVEQYVINNDFSFLNKIKPGLTDFSSIILRNESLVLDKLGGLKNYQKLLSIKLKLANLYANNKSLWLDFQLTFITILSIIFQKIAASLIINIYIMRLKPNLVPKINNIVQEEH